MINSLLSTSAIHDTFLTDGTVNKSCCSVLGSDWVCTAVMGNDVMKDLRG